MRKRRKLLVLLLAALLAGVFGWAFSRDKEPRYAGRTLSSWLADYSQIDERQFDEARHREADRAVQQIGSNAVPHLLKFISYRQPTWKRATISASHRLITTLPGALQFIPRDLTGNSSRVRATDAIFGFEALGPAAESAVPTLTEWALDTRPAHIERSGRATEALLSMRPLPKAAIARLLSGGPSQVRTLGYLANLPYSSRTRELLPSLIKCLHEARGAALKQAGGIITSLRMFDPEGTLAVFTNAVRSPRPEVRREALIGMYAFDRDAVPLVPFLRQFLTDPDPDVRKEATNLFGKIDPEALRPH